MVYGDDDNYLKLGHVSIWETRQTEFAKELAPVPERWPSYGNSVVTAPGRWTHLRLAVERLRGSEREQAGGDTERYTAYTRKDGRQWVRGGTWTHHLGGAARIGLVSMGGEGFTVAFDHVGCGGCGRGRSSRAVTARAQQTVTARCGRREGPAPAAASAGFSSPARQPVASAG